MILTPTRQHNTKEFNWHPNKKTFTACSSDLQWPIDQLQNVLQPTYDDAIDLGFTLISQRTGQAVTVAIDKEDTSPDYSGGWRALEFRPCDPKLRDTFKVIVFND